MTSLKLYDENMTTYEALNKMIRKYRSYNTVRFGSINGYVSLTKYFYIHVTTDLMHQYNHFVSEFQSSKRQLMNDLVHYFQSFFIKHLFTCESNK